MAQDLMTWVCFVAIILAAIGLNLVLICFMLVVMVAPEKMRGWFKRGVDWLVRETAK